MLDSQTAEQHKVVIEKEVLPKQPQTQEAVVRVLRLPVVTSHRTQQWKDLPAGLHVTIGTELLPVHKYRTPMSACFIQFQGCSL